MRARSCRTLFLTAAALLGIGTTGGGLLLSIAEGLPYLEGLWLAFTIVSTTGFGSGPATPAGIILAMIVFLIAVVAYVLLLVAAGESAMRRVQPTHPHREAQVVPEADIARIMRELSRN